jgi:putative ABC transport system permease protein
LKLVSAFIVAFAIALPYLKKQLAFMKTKKAAREQNTVYLQKILEERSMGGGNKTC